MSFASYAGLESKPSGPENEDDAREWDKTLQLCMSQYLRAGGIVTPSLWAALTDQERAMFAQAGDDLHAARAEASRHHERLVDLSSEQEISAALTEVMQR